MDPNDIDGVIVDGQAVYYRSGEVIAIGVAAARFVRNLEGLRLHSVDDENDADRKHEEILVRRVPNARERQDPATEIDASLAEGEGTDVAARALAAAIAEEVGRDDTTSVSPLPPAFRFTSVEDPEAVVAAAQSRGLRVQLNHVFFAHCGCGCDPCCGANPYGAFPLKATPLKATPLKATPLKATASVGTSAVPAVSVQNSETAIEDRPNLDVNVWIIDTGVTDGTVTTPLHAEIVNNSQKTDHPDQEPNGADGQVDPVAGHGTFIAGIIERLTPGCSIKVVDPIDGLGHLTEWDVADKIHDLVNNAGQDGNHLDRTILNLSFGGGLISDCNWCLSEAIATAQEGGVVVVASAGNDASCIPVYPGNFPGVTAVGAVDKDGDPAGFTNRGSWVDACALGVDIVSEFFNFEAFQGWAKWSGTSFATPVVVALIAEAMTTGSGQPAVAARDAVLAGGAYVPCLGVLVHEPAQVEALQAIS